MKPSRFDHSASRIATDNGEFINYQTKINCAILIQNLFSLLEATILPTKKPNFSMSMRTVGQALEITPLIGDWLNFLTI